MEIYIVLYLLGSVLVYVASKYYRTKVFNRPWKIWVRALAIFMALFSWLTIILWAISGAMTYVFYSDEEEDKIAKW